MLRVEKWANSLAIRLPEKIAAQLDWKQNTQLRESVVDGKLVIEAVKKPKYTLKDLLLQVTPENMPGEIDSGLAVGKEVW